MLNVFALFVVFILSLVATGADPKDANAYLRRGTDWLKKGEFDNAIDDYTEAIRLRPKNALAYKARGVVWVEKGALDEAIKDFTEAIRLDPKDAGSYNRRGVVWLEKAEFDNAIKDLQYISEKPDQDIPKKYNTHKPREAIELRTPPSLR